ncbi:glutathione S-transferase family protein [Ferrovibrio xuzhouensis]|uniref:Glutathione S-transferase family protein n=1 Tax=Ferrovibrio xuzhouensis TaxID=1576914 RepID=A0ABV7VFG6_9PROT
MITVHHLNNSRSQRVLWLLEELGVPYEVVRYQRRPDMLAPPELKKVHPLGKSPVITDSGITEDGRTIAETGAILDYILEKHGQGRLVPPAGSDEKLRFTYWLHYAEGSAMPLLLLKLIFLRLPGQVPGLLRPIVGMVAKKVQQRLTDPQLATALAFWNDELQQRGPWFAGADFSAADIIMSFPVEAASSRIGLGDHAALKDWLQRIHARPAYLKALETGGPYELMK